MMIENFVEWALLTLGSNVYFYLSDRLAGFVRPLLDIMQTIPTFSQEQVQDLALRHGLYLFYRLVRKLM
ncbi:hypothetical protein F7734_16200 [Scytonema sp. UIC 10036]|uniref:hypothetical protein n=1 Tax=Scytonema sp. UIC 10036 TaxID=2304196 RepID=UPI0012DA2211|nr:hypothetical protein [Scytonema sp. UIC 10036]MUG93870.1 hypothetical protein [Scytonema sp. UIC 10036]